MKKTIFLLLFSCKKESQPNKVLINIIQLSIKEHNEQYKINRSILQSKSEEQPIYYKETFEKLKSFENSIKTINDINLNLEEKKMMVKRIQTDLIHKFKLNEVTFFCLKTSDKVTFNQVLEFDLSRISNFFSKQLIQIHQSAHGWIK